VHTVRRGSGAPLVLVHGLGGSLRSWDLVVAGLAAEREVIAVDLPGFGASPPLPETTFGALTDAVAAFLGEHGLERAGLVGSSLGGRIVLELVRRGFGGDVVALDPGGFWNGQERAYVSASLRASRAAARRLLPAIPALTANPVSRSLLLAQFSARPWAVPGDAVRRELEGLATAPGTQPALDSLMAAPPQEGAPAGTAKGRLVIGWGRRDRLTLPTQAHRALAVFEDAVAHWFEGCGHFPQYDAPAETVRTILAATS